MNGDGAFFPSSYWDGITVTSGTHGTGPNAIEWNRAVEELIRVERWLLNDYFWDDLPVDSFTKKGVSDPSLETWKTVFELYKFSGTTPNKVLYFWKQLPHSWVIGTSIFPHVHWVTNEGGEGKVKWAIDYTIQNIGEIFSDPVSLENNVNIYEDDPLITDKHYITSLGEITTTDLKESCMIIGRLYRDAADTTNDTFANDALLLELDLHILKKVQPGSINQYGDY